MASSIQLLRSTNPQERPFAGNLLEGQPAANLHSSEPGLFFKTTDGSIVKFGPAAITSDGSPPNSAPQGASGNSVGELWLDKSVDPPVLKIYDGTTWIEAGSGGGGGGGSGAFVRWIYTASGGETSLSGSSGGVLLDYTPGLEEVYVNGVLLTRTTDYSAVNGTSITNLVPLSTGDVVTVLSMNPLEIIQLPGQVTLLRWTILATANQTVLSGVDSSSQQLVYTPGLEEVYVNGAFLRRGTDYLATNGSTITISSPLTENDEVTVMAWSTFEVGELSITDEDVATDAGIAATKLNFLPSDIDAVIRSVQSKASDVVSVKDFGAEGDGKTNDTDAIDAALATGKTIYFPQGTYMTTGGHRTFGDAQGILGDGHMKSIIKKLSGDGELFRVSQAFNFQWCSKIGFDCNGLGGTAVRWKGHYSYMRDVRIFNGSTDPNQWGLHFTGCNVSYFDGVIIEETANCILIDSNNDEPWPGPFVYSLLYTRFSNLFLVPKIGNAIKISGQAMGIAFDKSYIETATAVTPAPPAVLMLNPNPIANISFYNIETEHTVVQSAYIEMIGTSALSKEIYNINFRGGRLSASTVGHDKPAFKARYVDNLVIDGAWFYCDQTLPLRPHIEIQDCSNVKVANCSVYSYPNDFIFIKDNGGCQWVTDDTNTRLRINNSGGGGYNQWGNSTNICSINSGMTQSYSGTTRVTNTSNQLAPLVRAYNSSTAGLAHNTLTKWAFSTVDAGYNPNEEYDVSTYRFTPTVRGFYSVTISGVLNAATDDCAFFGAIYKNGSEFSRSETTGTGSLGINLTDVVFLNGTTDFIEGYFYQFNNTSATVRNVAANAFFTSNFVRSV